MFNFKILKELDREFATLQMNYENNYRDLAKQETSDLIKKIEELKNKGILKGKKYDQYKAKIDDYAKRMIDYHY